MDDLHVVDVKRRSIFWEVHLSNGKVMHIATSRYPDELGAFTYVTNKLKEQANGTNSRA
jgi:hypothetical protein